MKRRTVLKLLAAPALMTLARPGFAQAKEKVTYAYLLDPAYDAVTWAMTNGKVTSDLIDGRSARARDSAADPGHVGQTVRRDHDGGDRDSAGGGARARAAGLSTALQQSRRRRRRRRLGQERFADQAPEGAQGQVARLLRRCARPATRRCASRSSTNTASTPRSKAATSSKSRSRRPICRLRSPPARSMRRRSSTARRFAR